MNDDRREREELSKLEALFRADPGPTPSELAEARLGLKRVLAREQSGRGQDAGGPSAPTSSPTSSPMPSMIRLASRRFLRTFAQAAGFALLMALLAPLLPRLLPPGASARASVDLVASFVDEARSVRDRLKPLLPSLPSLPSFPSLPELPMSPTMEMRGAPASRLFDWIPSLHSDTR